MNKFYLLCILTISLLFLIIISCGPILPELTISGDVKGTINIDRSRIQGEPYYIDYTEKGLILGTTEKDGAAYITRTYAIKNKTNISLIEKKSSDKMYDNLFWDEENVETIGGGEACLGALMAATPCGGTVDQYGLTLQKQLSDGAFFKYSCFTETQRSQTGFGALSQTKEAKGNQESIIYKKEQTIVDANSLELDPRGFEKVSWFTSNRSKYPWLAKIYYLENYNKLIFLSAPSRNKRGVYFVDFNQLIQKKRMIKLNEFPFTDIAIHTEKKVAFILKVNKTNDQWIIEIVSNNNLFSE